jgi:hypothetical protein
MSNMARMCYEYGDAMDCDKQASCISPVCERHTAYLEANAHFDHCDRCELENGGCHCGERDENDELFNCAIGRC